MRRARSQHVVMVVEDDADAREVLTDLVSDEGYGTLAVSNGREALDELEAGKAKQLPCVILLDMMMPVMDGQQFRAAQLLDPALADIPVVVVSAHIDANVTVESMNVAGFLRKPFDFAAVLEVLERHCPG